MLSSPVWQSLANIDLDDEEYRCFTSEAKALGIYDAVFSEIRANTEDCLAPDL